VKLGTNLIRLAATDISNHLACGHLTTLDLRVVRGEVSAPEFRSPDLQVLRELGLRHEAEYLDSLRKLGLQVVDLRDLRDDAYRGCRQDRTEKERPLYACGQANSYRTARISSRPQL
jgi:hypothetical protein